MPNPSRMHMVWHYYDAFSLQELGLMMYLQRRKMGKKCENCGRPYVGTPEQKYCSRKCCLRAYYKRRYQRLKEKRSRESTNGS